jgi:hypothetical protein
MLENGADESEGESYYPQHADPQLEELLRRQQDILANDKIK